MASMAGTTLLWRDPTALALALLLWSRGVEVELKWVGPPSSPSRAVTELVFVPLFFYLDYYLPLFQ
jgi:hypothetical protein